MNEEKALQCHTEAPSAADWPAASSCRLKLQERRPWQPLWPHNGEGSGKGKDILGQSVPCPDVTATHLKE